MPTHPVSLRTALVAWLALAAPAIGAAQGAAAGPGEPLGGYVSTKVSVMPAQFLRGDSAAPVKPAEWAKLRLELDDSLGTAIAERGVGKKWAYATDIARMAKRNAAYTSDPYALGAGSLRVRPLQPGEQASAGIVNNLRSLIALGDSRFALIPVELSFARKGAQVVPTLRLVLLDGRSGQVAWFGDVAGRPGTGFAAAEIGALAQRVADLVAAR